MRRNQGYRYREVLGPSSAGNTALSYLTAHFTHSTESQWRERFAASEIHWNGKTANGAEPLHPGGVLVWDRPGWDEEDAPQTYHVIFEDEHLVVVDKPSGLPTIPGAGFFLNTLLQQVREAFPDANPLHRLGRATSGLVMFARNAKAAAAMQRQWSITVQKHYLALGSFIAAQDHYDIQASIGEMDHPRLGKVWAAVPSGKTARSVAHVLQRRVDSTLFEVQLHTGRPHQIRIHLATIGHPLLGDPLFESGGKPKKENPGLPGDSGYWLHAHRLVFEHPATKQQLELEATPPAILRCD